MRQTLHARSWTRTLYLYLAALIGLLLVTIGGVRLVDLGLRSWVFTAADRLDAMHMYQPPLPHALERVRAAAEPESGLTEEERAMIRQWLAEYRRWEERQVSADPVLARRQAAAASSLAMILIGLPLYLYHWGTIRRENRLQAEELA
jgi:hypothetical protein